jgi:hypothetical protein
MTKEQLREVYGGFNDRPPNLKELTEEEFAQSSFFVYSPVREEYRQPTNKYPGRTPSWGFAGDLRLYYMGDGTGYAVHADYWEGKVTWYKFAACEHTYRELGQAESREKGIPHFGMCYHVEECITCGYTRSYDSSG